MSSASTKFRCIVADPPWRVEAGPRGGGYSSGEPGQKQWMWRKSSHASRKLPYPALSVQQIAQTPVQPFADRDCHLWLWVINRYVPDAYDVARAWGFEPSTLLTWAKRPMGGGLGGTFGISTEHILFATRGRVDARARVTGTSFDWKRPYVNGKPAHSRKPPEFFAMAERVSHAERLELFARAPRPHWRVWGNEVESDIQIEVPKP